jgi:DNA-binding NtrC family response regulator
VDVRVVAATNRDLRQEVALGRFREDLFYRLYVVPIRVPPLRERREDIPLLAAHFVEDFHRTTGKRLVLEPDVLAALEEYPFPGNVRELKNLVSRLGALAAGERVTAADLPAYVTGEKVVSLEKDPFRRFLRSEPSTNEELKAARSEMQAVFDGYVRRLEGKFLKQLLAEAGGNVSEAARRAGINRTLLHRKIKEAEEG